MSRFRQMAELVSALDDPAGPLHRCTLLACSLLLALSASVPLPTQAQVAAPDWTQIKRVVAAQRDALKAGNAELAFSFAAPGIRAQFGSPENFLAMVRSGYAALLDARYVEFLDGAVIEGNVIQPLRLILPDNSVQVALYTMARQADGEWRITGCVVAPSTTRAA